MKKETVLLIDGDIIAYRMSAAVDTRSVLVTHLPTKKQKVFKHRTEFKKLLERKGKLESIDEYSIDDMIEFEDVSHCLRNIKLKLKQLKVMTGADRTEIYISGDKNFRLDLDLPTKYKGNRDGSYRPTHLNESKEYLVSVHGAVKAYEIEADDILSVRAYEEIDKGNRAIIASVDKDTLQAEGIGFLDWTQEEPEVYWISPDTLGAVWDTGKKITGHGLKFLAYQILCGDPVDGYKPTQLSKSKYGGKTAVKDLKDLKTKEEVAALVVKRYKEFYPEEFEYVAWNGKVIKSSWEHMLDIYFRCAYMKRSWDDESDWKKFLGYSV